VVLGEDRPPVPRDVLLALDVEGEVAGADEPLDERNERRLPERVVDGGGRLRGRCVVRGEQGFSSGRRICFANTAGSSARMGPAASRRATARAVR
jgi:hypothetical protein